MPLVTDNEGLMLMLDEQRLYYYSRDTKGRIKILGAPNTKFSENVLDLIKDEEFVYLVCEALYPLEPRYKDPRTMTIMYPGRYAVIGRDVYVGCRDFDFDIATAAVARNILHYYKLLDPNRTPSDAA